MKEVNKRFINIHTNYSPINNNLHQHLVPSYPAPLGPLPEYGYVYYPSFEGLPPSYAPDISSCYAPDLLQRIGKPLDVPVYHLPFLQEPHEIPLLDVPVNYQTGSFQHMLAFNPLPQTIQTQGVQIKDRFTPPFLKHLGSGLKEGCLQEIISPSILPLSFTSHLDPRIHQTKISAAPSLHRARSSPGSKPRSQLLEGFRNNRCPLVSLQDIANHCIEFSQDQHGSRFIQQKLEQSSHQTIQLFFKEVESGLKGLMLDVFGNYVVQKLLEFGTDEIKQEIQAKVLENLLTLSFHQYGCRVVQKMISIFSTQTAADIVKRLDDKLVECMKEQHGNHVIQKCVEKVEESVLDNIIAKSTGKIIDISCDPYGCRVVQRFLENANLQQRRLILSEVNPTIYSLIQDQYGNYIVQHILDYGSKEETEKIAQSICGHVVELSQHKYASNVLEKCVERTGETNRALFITELVNSGELGPVIEGQYSNYVLQKMMDTCPSVVLQTLMTQLRQHKSSMEKQSYGKNIWARLEKYFLEIKHLT